MDDGAAPTATLPPSANASASLPELLPPSGTAPPLPAASCGACNASNAHCAGGSCVCHDGWQGASCDECLAGALCYSCDAAQCGEHGACGAGGKCACDQGWKGLSCDVVDDAPLAVVWAVQMPPTVQRIAVCATMTSHSCALRSPLRGSGTEAGGLDIILSTAAVHHAAGAPAPSPETARASPLVT